MSQINCPACGAKTSSVVANCEYCGIEIARVNKLSAEEYMASIQKRLDAITNEEFKFDHHKTKAQTEAIMLLPLPSSTEALVGLFTYCHGHNQIFNALGDGPPAEIIKAWRGKATSAYDRLRVISLNNPQLSEFLKEYSGTYSPEAVERRATAEGRSSMLSFLFAIAVIGLLVALIAVIEFGKK